MEGKELKILIKRIAKRDSYTIGHVFLNGEYFCDSAEDTDRGLSSEMSLTEILEKKVKSKTAIPTGSYQVTLNVVSPRFSKSTKYDFCSGKLPRLLNVPGYDGVLIHIGNTPQDTDGCILLGKNNVKGQVVESTSTFKEFYNRISKFNAITITIE